jgi:hypothetical protein
MQAFKKVPSVNEKMLLKVVPKRKLILLTHTYCGANNGIRRNYHLKTQNARKTNNLDKCAN